MAAWYGGTMSRRQLRLEPLFRGDADDAVATPSPNAKISIVEHLLYLGSYGRETQFTSTTESEDAAGHFAGPNGAVWVTDTGRAASGGAKHLSKKELLGNLQGYGMGRAKWTDKWQVAQARGLVARWSEHLLDWSAVPAGEVETRVATTFNKRKKTRRR